MLTGQLLQQLDQRHQVGDQDLDLDLSSLNIPWHWFLNTRALWSVSDIQLATQQQPVSMLQVLELVPEMIGQCGMGGEGDTVRWMDSRGGPLPQWCSGARNALLFPQSSVRHSPPRPSAATVSSANVSMDTKCRTT